MTTQRFLVYALTEFDGVLTQAFDKLEEVQAYLKVNSWVLGPDNDDDSYVVLFERVSDDWYQS